MNPPFEEPSIPEKLKWPLAALWISLGLHGALIALVHVAPPPAGVGGGDIQARLVAVPPPVTVPHLAPNLETDETIAVEPTEADKAVDPVPVSNTPLPPEQNVPPPSQPVTPHLEIPIAVDLNYYPARELDQTPRGQIPDPVFPSTLVGRIKFEVKIEENGEVSDIEVLESNPPDSFDKASLDIALEALRRTRFTPGIKNGRPVRASVIYELTINAPATQDEMR